MAHYGGTKEMAALTMIGEQMRPPAVMPGATQIVMWSEAATAEVPSTFYFPPQPQLQLNSQLWSQPRTNYGLKEPDTSRGTVLIVEDDEAILSALIDILELEGYSVETAMDGAKGLDRLEHTEPTLILLDMRMPVLNGWDFARIARQRGNTVPILVMTAAQDARRWAHEIGADGYIPKPFHLPDLLDAVERFHQS